MKKINDFSSYVEVAKFKKVVDMRADAPRKWTKVQPRAWNGEEFKGQKPTFPASANAFQGKTKNGVGNTNSSTLCVIGVGSPEGARGRGIDSGPPTPFRAVFAPHSRLPTIGRQRGDGSPETSGGFQGMETAGGGRKAERDGRSAPWRRAGESPAISIPP